MGEQFTSLPKEGQEGVREGFINEAMKAVVGCNMHFLASANRLKDTASLVPPSLSTRFNELTRTLISSDASVVQFDSAVAEIQSDFPKCRGWLSWWMQPWVVSMAFPAKSQVPPNVRDEVPNTTNAVEHQHSLLNDACGYGHDLLDGVHALLRHIQQLAALHRVAKSE